MDLRKTIASALKQAMPALGNITDASVTVSRAGSGTYDPTAGTVGGSIVSGTCPATFVTPEKKRENIPSQTTESNRVSPEADAKVIIQVSDLAFHPLKNDTIVRADGSKYVVLDDYSDPAGAVYVLAVKRTSSG